MANLSEILDGANQGGGIAALGREFGLTPEQTQASVAAFLPAISSGLKQSTSDINGLANLFALMGQQKDLPELYDDVKLAASPDGVGAGDQVLRVIFRSPEVSDALVEQAQNISGVSASVLEKFLPALAGIAVSGLMRSGAAEEGPLKAQGALSPPLGGGIGDILGQIFGRVLSGSAPAPAPAPGGGGGLGDILGQIFGRQMPQPGGGGAPFPAPADTGGQAGGGGDLLGMILRELLKGIQNGTIKPVIIGGGGPVQIPWPGGQGPSGGAEAPQVPGGDIFGQILRDILGGALGGGAQPQGGGAPIPQMPQGGGQAQAPTPPMKDLSDLTRQLGVMGGAGAAVFGDRFEHGQDLEQSHLDNIQGIVDRSFGA